MKMRRSMLWLVAAPALWVGCMPDIPQDPEPSARVSAVFDPETSTVPLPNSAALDDDGTLPALEGAGEDDANGAFLSWLDGLHGWSEATPITIPFSGPLDESTVTTDNVKLFRHDEDGATAIEITAVQHVANDEDGSVCNPAVCGAIIRVLPAETPQFGVTYSVVATKDIKGENGAEVSESAAIFFAASPSPLVTEDGTIIPTVFDPGVADDVRTVTDLEALRQLLAPVFEAAEEAGIERNRVASAQNWTVAADPFTVLDPVTATIPIPNTLAIEPDGTFPSAALNYCGGPDVDPASLTDTTCGAPGPQFHSCSTTSDCDQYRTDTQPGGQCVGGRCMYTNCAQGQFDAYLDSLHGWPTTTPITLPVTAEIDPTTLTPDSVQVWAVIDDVPTKVDGTTVTMSECGDEIVVGLPGPMGYNTSYIAFATKDVRGSNGLPLLPPAAVVLAMMPYDPGELVGDCTEEQAGTACEGGGFCGAIPGQGFKCVDSLVPNASDADAAAVMAIRPLFQPAVAAASAAGVEWDDLAAIWTWQTWTDTFVVFDPAAGQIPFPHTLLTTGCPNDEPICNLPDAEGPTGAIIDELKRREGFSSTAPHWIPTIGPPLDESTVKTEPPMEAGVLFAEANVIPPPLFPADQWSVSYEFNHIIARFNRPLIQDDLVAGLTTTNLMGSNGFPAQPSPAFVFLRSEYPLIRGTLMEDGTCVPPEGATECSPAIAQIPDTNTALLLEASRQEFEQLFLVALLFGYGRAQVNNAWAFVTQPTTQSMQRLRAQTINAIAGGAPVATASSPDIDTTPFVNGDDTVPDPDMVTASIDMSNVQEIHWNIEFDNVNWVDENDRLLQTPTSAQVGVSIFVPKPAGGCVPPYDVAIAQHGHTNYRKNMGLSVANAMAGACIATVAMDLPKHGGRIPGSPALHPATRPAESGAEYITEDFVGTLNTFKQAAMDHVVLIRMIKEGAFDAAVGGTFSDATSQIGYVGNSLGAFAGALISTIEPDLGPAILNVVGGNFGTILKESESYGPLFEATGIPRDTFEELQALHFVQWLGEEADPYTFAPYPVLNPLTEVLYDGTSFTDGTQLPSKDIIIQMVTGDTVVPNSATEPVARVMGVDLTDTTFPAGTPHGFLAHIDPAAADAAAHDCAVTQAVEWMSSSFAGTAALTTSVAECGL